MSRVTDRKKQRRDYVERKAGAYASGMVWSALFLPCTMIAISLLVASIGLFAYAVFLAFSQEAYASYLWGAMGSLVGAGVFAFYTWMFWVGIQEARKSARVPYVPPVTANTLPAEEVLVRGSHAPPVVQSEVLLRAATGQETPTEELLRVAADGDNGRP